MAYQDAFMRALRNRPVPRKRPPRRAPAASAAAAPAAAAGPLAPWSDERIQSESDARVRAALAALAAPIESARARTETQSKANQDALEGLGLAAAGLLQGIGPGIQQGYDRAASGVASLAGGFSSGMADRVRAAQRGSQDFVAQQTPGATPPVGADPTDLQDVSFGLGGFFDSASLQTQGAAANRWGQVLPGIHALETTQSVQREQARAAQEDDQYEQQLIDLATKQPELRAQVLDQLYKLELEKLSARLAQKDDKRKDKQLSLDARQVAVQERAQGLYERQFQEAARSNRADEAIEWAGLQLQNKKAAQAVANAEAKGKQIDAAASKVRGFVVDKNGDFVLDENGKRIPVKNTTTSKTDKNKLYRDAVEHAREIAPKPVENPNVSSLTPGKYLAKPGAKGVFKRPGFPATTNDPKKARTEGEMTFAEAQMYLMERYGLTRARARQALIASGWKPDGKRPATAPTGR